MTYAQFEDLPVWQDATATRAFKAQLDRAALSVSNNIAEDFERGTTNELLSLIYIARGSAGEVRSMLCLKERRVQTAGWPVDLRSEISNLKAIAVSCSKQLRAWPEYFQNSGIRGQRHLTESSRRQADQRKRAAAFNEELLRKLPPAHPLRVTKQLHATLKSEIPKSEI